MVEQLLDKIDIVEIISESVALSKAGPNYKGLCPFHSEKTPSFVVSPKKNLFKCFGCGIAGDGLTFYMKKKNLSFMEAVKELGAKYRVEININKKDDKYNKILEDAAQFFRESLFKQEGKEALKYLKGRNFNEDFLYEHMVGYAPFEGLRKALAKHSEKDLEMLGLIQDGKDIFRNRVMFTIYDSSKRVIAFGGRALNDILPKYLNSKESIAFKKSYNLYGIFKTSDLREKDYIILVEGYTDVLAMRRDSFKNVVASLGTSLTEGQAKLLKKFTQNIIIMYDSDTAGLKATERAIFILKKEGFSVKVVSLESKDPDEFLNKYGSEALKEKIKNSVEVFDYLMKLYRKGEGVIDKRKTIENFKPFFESLSPLEKELYLERLANELKISKESLSYKPKKVEKQEIKRYLNHLEEDTLILALQEETLLNRIDKRSFSNTKISFLSSAKNLKEEIESFLDSLGYNKEVKFNASKEEMIEGIVNSWKKKLLKEELEAIEYMLKSSGSRDELIKQYYLKKQELEKLGG